MGKIHFGFVIGLSVFLLVSCIKKEIQFGNELGDSYTRLIEVDTVGVNMSTFLLDSFATNNISEFLVGCYNDTLLGKITAKPFLQLSPPEDIDLETDAVYDSVSFVIRLNKYYYGDTTQAQTIVIRELVQAIAYSYGNSLFNTSSISENPLPLGTRYLRIRPGLGDSIAVKLSDSKGLELFNKMKQKSSDLKGVFNFLNYFKGVSVAFSFNDESAVYGFNHSPDSVFIRLHYHVTNPYFQKKAKDFPFYSNIYFNQIIADRSATPLSSASGDEISSAVLNDKAYMQSATGVLLKMTFPGLRHILKIDATVRLLKATLKLNVAENSFDKKLWLPSFLVLSQTNATNTIGTPLLDSSGSNILYGFPIADNIYDAATFYSFDVTGYINHLLTNPGKEQGGLFLIQSRPGTSGAATRAIIDNSKSGKFASKLILSLVTLKD